MSERKPVGDDYVLATGAAGAARLALLDRTYGPDSERIMLGLGIPEGGRVADIGCGTGNAARWFARQTGTKGEVTALDVSDDQLAIAREAALRDGLDNINFVEGDAYATSLPRDHFDVVHCRFLLCHLRRPSDALREMVAICRPGGLVICCDVDLGGIASTPATHGNDRMRELFESGVRLRGLDPTVGMRMPRMFIAAGLPNPDFAISQPAFLRGEGERLWEYTYLEGLEARIASEAVERAEAERLALDWLEVARDETILVTLARMPITWARKPF